jgi:uncharacterized repeat protein (TIGR03809 family)
MTHRHDVARGRDIVARWCDLAEARLEYLTELFETGRWRRFHSELDFLENIQEAKAAVETWRDLSSREASRDNSAIDISWLGRGRLTPSRGQAAPDQIDRLQSLAAATKPQPSNLSTAAKSDHVSSHHGSSLPEAEAPPIEPAWGNAGLTLDITVMEERYPLLRNAL